MANTYFMADTLPTAFYCEGCLLRGAYINLVIVLRTLNLCEGWPKAIKLCELQFANTSSEACTTQSKHAQHSPSPVQAQLPIR